MTWTDEVPTEDGWYWVKYKKRSLPEVSRLFEGRWFWIGCDTSTPPVTFGPRIPTPEELEAVRKALANCLAIVRTQNGNLYEDTNQIQREAEAALDKLKGGAT